MSKKNSSVKYNNKIFDRNFNYDKSSASFNENILQDRAFIKIINSDDTNKNIISKLGSRFIETANQWSEVNSNNLENNKLSILNDREIMSDIDVKLDDNFQNTISDRIFNINPNMNQVETEDYFRDINKNNFDIRKTSNKINIKKNIVINPNKKYKYFVDPNNDISMKMLTYYQYKLKNKFVCSSYGLLTILCLFYIGTVKETKNELEKYLKISDKNNLYNSLIDINKNIQKIDIKNYFFINNKIKLSNNYKKLFRKIGIIESIDINNTPNKIKNLLNSNLNNLVNKSTNIILINTISFKPIWKINFLKENTQEKEFYDLVNTKKVKMMQLFNESLPYYEDNRYQLLEIPLKDNNLIIGIMLEKTVNQLIIPPKAETLYSNITKLKTEKVNVQIPKFNTDTIINSSDILKFIGLQKIFQNADIDNMLDNSINTNIAINNIIQKTSIIFSESEIINKSRDLSYNNNNNNNIFNFYANHPFTYYVRHVSNNIIFLTGYYN